VLGGSWIRMKATIDTANIMMTVDTSRSLIIRSMGVLSSTPTFPR
jgi:hypothetical protein